MMELSVGNVCTCMVLVLALLISWNWTIIQAYTREATTVLYRPFPTWPTARYSRKGWRDTHEVINLHSQTHKEDITLVFLGDSITEGWKTDGKNVWKKYYNNLTAVNYGIKGDRTEHLLWRIQNGNVEGLYPLVTVVLIGTNNANWGNSGREIADGVFAVVGELRQRLPSTRILLLGIFPRGSTSKDARRIAVLEANDIIEHDMKEPMVTYLDFGHKFLGEGKNISLELMYDYVHLTEKGYEIWASSMDSTLKALLSRNNN